MVSNLDLLTDEYAKFFKVTAANSTVLATMSEN